ncbi:glycosyltransferase family 2 protein [Metabacillus schmidteae]|uniref:glycosyltransferase family 2 protein n=1 Tax=Metabacillus schmidteae TaxID=2730405 RepID=UPI001589FA16|nr:glycosyltransferase family 2 protein [Metabacillus schmidteae]
MISKKISIIIPMYNVKDYIVETIESVINQTMEDIELVLIDDCSSDGTYEIAKKYLERYPNITLIRNKKNQGVSASRNIGLKLSKGHYIYFLDSDDYIEKDAIKKLYMAAQRENADLVIGNHLIYQNEETKSPWMLEKFPSLTMAGEKNLLKNPELYFLIYSCGKLFSKELINDLKFSEQIYNGEDQPFTLYAYLNAKKIYLEPCITFYYRMRKPGDVSLSQTEGLLEEKITGFINMIELSKKYIDESPNEPNIKEDLFIFYLNRVLTLNLWNPLSKALKSPSKYNCFSIIRTLNISVNNLTDEVVLKTPAITEYIRNIKPYVYALNKEVAKEYLKLLKTIKEKRDRAKNRLL